MSTLTRATTITGVTKKDTAKGEVFLIASGDGTEYTTFQGALANQAFNLIGQQVEISYVEKDVTKGDRTFINRYYEGARPATQPAFGNATAAATPANSFPTIPVAASEPDREIKIMRQTATKVAAQLLGHLPPEERTKTGLLVISDFLVDYYQHGQSVTSPAIVNDPGPVAAPVHTDDDFPF